MLEIRAKTLAFQNWVVGASDQNVWCYCCKLFCYRAAKTLVEPGLLVSFETFSVQCMAGGPKV